MRLWQVQQTRQATTRLVRFGFSMPAAYIRRACVWRRKYEVDGLSVDMCGRYVRRSDKRRIAERFVVHGPALPDFGPSWNVAPQTFQPIVRLNRDTGEREVVLMR